MEKRQKVEKQGYWYLLEWDSQFCWCSRWILGYDGERHLQYEPTEKVWSQRLGLLRSLLIDIRHVSFQQSKLHQRKWLAKKCIYQFPLF